jgi:hypothetical protein
MGVHDDYILFTVQSFLIDSSSVPSCNGGFVSSVLVFWISSTSPVLLFTAAFPCVVCHAHMLFTVTMVVDVLICVDLLDRCNGWSRDIRSHCSR